MSNSPTKWVLTRDFQRPRKMHLRVKKALGRHKFHDSLLGYVGQIITQPTCS